MDKKYKFRDIEKKWLKKYCNKEIFKTKIDQSKQNYSIVLPPPNVTGILHMGHAFQISLMDLLIRYNKMNGKNVLWQGGVDHAGIATQILVEKNLAEKKIYKEELGKVKFIEQVWQWKNKYGDNIIDQIKRMGASIDWSRSCFTLDDKFSKAVNETFINLYKQGLIYKDKKLINWDPVLQSAVSDIEVNNKEKLGFLYYIKYKIKSSNNFLTIATTRPETILADSAVAVNPNDERYKQLIGQTILVPIINREIIVIADDYVDPDFGTGCLKITPAHDFNDYEIGKKHKLKFINILNPNATINDLAPIEYRGLNIQQARIKIIKQITDLKQLAKQEKYLLSTPIGEKTGSLIEPYLTEQWFVSVKEMAKQAKNLVADHSIKIIPKNWEKIYFNWLNNINDWCISRQLWWGHQIPIYYDEKNNLYLGSSIDEIRQKYNLTTKINLTREQSVLDTWFSSALWTFATMDWFNDKENEVFKAFHPTNLLITGFDIIFFWVARMIMFTDHITKQIPFKQVYFTGLIRDQSGQKMSKSKGNTIDPIDVIEGINKNDLLIKKSNNFIKNEQKDKINQLIEKDFPNGIKPHGTDGLRFAFYSLASQGMDINFNLNRIESSRNFINKIWNATRFVLMSCEDFTLKADNIYYQSIYDKWLEYKFNDLLTDIEVNLNNYRFDILAGKCFHFFWHDFCDWYLEFTKIELTNSFQNVAYNLLINLEKIIRALHPMLPFITEEIHEKLREKLNNKDLDSLFLAKYPQKTSSNFLKEFKKIEEVKQIVQAIRTIRAENNVPQKLEIDAYFIGDQHDYNRIIYYKNIVYKLAKLKSLKLTSVIQEKTLFHKINNYELHLPIDNFINQEEQKIKLELENKKLKIEAEKLNINLNNKKFLANAPHKIIENQKARLEELKDLIKANLKKSSNL